MTYEQIEKEFDKKFVYMGDWNKYDPHTGMGVVSSPKLIKSFLKQSFIKYLEGQQELVKDLAVGVSIDQRGRKWIDLEDLIKLYQTQIKELQ